MAVWRVLGDSATLSSATTPKPLPHKDLLRLPVVVALVVRPGVAKPKVAILLRSGDDGKEVERCSLSASTLFGSFGVQQH